jgi:hypothetical protein
MHKRSAESATLADRLRLILLLDACEAANLSPIPVMRFHALAFLANVLAPVWSVESYDGKILKRNDGPYYPELQIELDRLIGLGFVTIKDVRYVNDNGRWRLEGAFGLNASLAQPIVEDAKVFADEQAIIAFLRRLAFAVARLKEPLDDLIKFDSTWSDLRTGIGDVIDFSEWRTANYSAFTARLFNLQLPRNLPASRGDQVQLYMRLLAKRASDAA